jgi:hypothetical protein
MTALEFKNELIRRLNQNANRYHGGTCNGKEYPNIKTFDVDEVYEIIDRVYENIPEDVRVNI